MKVGRGKGGGWFRWTLTGIFGSKAGIGRKPRHLCTCAEAEFIGVRKGCLLVATEVAAGR